MKKRYLKPVIASTILVVTVSLLIRYLSENPDYVAELRHIGLGWVVLIVVINFAALSALAGIGMVLIQMTGKRLASKENFLLTMYSSIANFLGPLQSGPGVRAAYLKTKHHVSLRAYFLVTLLYYGIFAVMSAFLLLIGTRPWWQAVMASLSAAGFSYVVIRYAANKRKKEQALLRITPRLVSLLAVFTLIQVLLVGMRYFAAMHAANDDVSLGSALSYTGAANFALFVSITPDGIGIREAFLYFAQNIHHVSTHTIIATNIIDRACYVLFIIISLGLGLVLHVHDRFTTHQATDAAADQ
ncbi:MAG: lysylphosphatidylglycerol synthase transmembrane domain-containing protein [Candidatus Saccharimonadales bacterium]|jgi:uncharacterized membrane protein YbhN (UPF0104 family)|nr:flippase-like domain-containing protein [Candidatus Saccharibacteria bacterium]